MAIVNFCYFRSSVSNMLMSDTSVPKLLLLVSGEKDIKVVALP